MINILLITDLEPKGELWIIITGVIFIILLSIGAASNGIKHQEHKKRIEEEIRKSKLN